MKRARPYIPYKHDPGYFANEDPQGAPNPGTHFINQLGIGVKPATRLNTGKNKPAVQQFGRIYVGPQTGTARRKGPGAHRPGGGDFK